MLFLNDILPYPEPMLQDQKALRDLQQGVFILMALENKGKPMEWYLLSSRILV